MMLLLPHENFSSGHKDQTSKLRSSKNLAQDDFLDAENENPLNHQTLKKLRDRPRNAVVPAKSSNSIFDHSADEQVTIMPD